MGSSYLPEKSFVICTNQSGTDYKELQPTRKVSVYLKDNRAFLTNVDKKIESDFTCKTHWNKGLSEAAFGGGVAVALGVAAASATVPVVGWIVGGIIAIVAIGVAINEISKTPQCNGALGNRLSQWKLYHPTVFFDKQNAVLGSSVLSCGEGGILLPFVSKIAAENAAKAIGHNNELQMGINFLANGFMGYAFGELLIGGQVITLVTGVYLGANVVDPSAKWVGDKYADSYKNEHYEDVRTALGEKPEEKKTLMDNVMGTANPQNDVKEIIENKNKIIEEMKARGESREAIESFEKTVGEAERTGTFGKNNPEAQETLKNIKEGKYGPEVKDIFIGKRGATGLHTEKSYNKAEQFEKNKIQLSKIESLKDAGKGASVALALAQPFINNVMDKHALIKAIKIQEAANEDGASNSISVVSSEH